MRTGRVNISLCSRMLLQNPHDRNGTPAACKYEISSPILPHMLEAEPRAKPRSKAV